MINNHNTNIYEQSQFGFNICDESSYTHNSTISDTRLREICFNYIVISWLVRLQYAIIIREYNAHAWHENKHIYQECGFHTLIPITMTVLTASLCTNAYTNLLTINNAPPSTSRRNIYVAACGSTIWTVERSSQYIYIYIWANPITWTMWNICKPHSPFTSLWADMYPHAFTPGTASANELQCKTNWLSHAHLWNCIQQATCKWWVYQLSVLYVYICYNTQCLWCDLCVWQMFQMWTNFDRETHNRAFDAHMVGRTSTSYNATSFRPTLTSYNI